MTLITTFFFPFTSFAGVLDIDDSLDHHYAQCVSWGMNHPLRNRMRIEGRENNSTFLESLNDFCLCKRKVDKDEVKRSHNKKLGYFFSGRGHYFSEIDICLQENSQPKEFEYLFGMLLYDQVKPLLNTFIEESHNQGLEKVVGREMANSLDDCLQVELMKSCKKVSSLFFVYKCIKRKVKDRGFMERMKRECRKKPLYESELI
ncbi:MAG: hypothetical protein NXH75_11025 [Halobacteriovoraceae bacterium]|nr:hypothetical protein [Halobacteriovoraceae bacterium]